MDLYSQWQKAAKNAIIENLYGPTEATVAVTNYRWDQDTSPAVSDNGIVPIGWTFETQRSCIVDENLNVVPQGMKGELCLTGSQVTKGYFNNDKKTQLQFITIPNLGQDIWYRTGDLVKEDENGCMHYLGRIDNQIKILGYRIELQEIDSVVRAASANELAVAVAWPYEEKDAQGIVAFVQGGDTLKTKEQIMDYCRRSLPSYMVPSKIVFIDTMPLSSNGKIDRLELVNILEKGES